MIRMPQCLMDEERKLTEEFLSQYSENEMNREMTDDEYASWEKELLEWMDQHESRELKLFGEYLKWRGDEGQLCDGNGRPLLTDPDEPYSWIQEWDVNEEGYCLYKGTDKLILNTDGTPIKNPVLDKSILELYEKERG